MARNGLGKSEGRGHRNLERGRDGIRAVAVISPRERDLVAGVLEGAGDALRARPRPAHPRARHHGNDENLHGSRVRHSQHPHAGLVLPLMHEAGAEFRGQLTDASWLS